MVNVLNIRLHAISTKHQTGSSSVAFKGMPVSPLMPVNISTGYSSPAMMNWLINTLMLGVSNAAL